MSNTTTEQTNRPVKSIRFGAVEASIWENRNEDVKSYGVTFERHYKASDTWKSSSTFRAEHLLLLAKAADAAHTAICTELR